MAETEKSKGGKIGGAIALTIAAIIAFLFLRKKAQPICTPGEEKCIGLDKCRCKDDGTGWIVVTPNATECAPLPGTAVLHGIVTDSQTGLPVGGIVVSCDSYTGATGSSDGLYSIENIPPGTYDVLFSDPLNRYEPLTI